MMHDRNFETTRMMTHQNLKKQVMRGKVKTNEKRSEEEMVMPQQNHNINSLNGNSLDCNVCEAQTLADTMCDFNDTFKMEEISQTFGSRAPKENTKTKINSMKKSMRHLMTKKA